MQNLSIFSYNKMYPLLAGIPVALNTVYVHGTFAIIRSEY